ncbi:MAG: hypothetical protein KAX28_11610, partial [Candidatus Marinimicrobia bacterium]|nr:hypothetical protein [Candidatus Neomarinimicrobiota bacterium]
LFIINYHLSKDIKENATCQEKYFPFFKNESTKKGIILQKETARLTKVGQVETVGSFGLCLIRLK